jgi:hypothetical protein
MSIKYFPPRFKNYKFPSTGEKLVYEKLNTVNNYSINENWFVFHDVRIKDHSSQKEGQTDFLILCKKGLLVLEVKGGIIIRENRQFFQEGNSMFPRNPIDPVYQINGNYDSLYKYFQLKKREGIIDYLPFIGKAMAFPQTPNNSFSDLEFDPREIYVKSQSNCIWKFINESFNYQIDKVTKSDSYQHRDLTAEQIKKLIEILSPKVAIEPRFLDSIEKLSTTILLNQENNNLILGLEENPFIMIEGGPGTGKTTFAKAFIENNELKDKNGLYLCDNRLLKNELDDVFQGFKLKAKTLAEYINDFGSLITIDSQPSHYMKAIDQLKFEHGFDYLVIDEAQDLFSKNISLLWEKMNNYKKLDTLVLYDNEQSYAYNTLIDKNIYDKNLQEFKSKASKYSQKHIYRTKGNSGISEFYTDIYSNNYKPDLEKDYYGDVVIKRPKDFRSAMILLKDDITELIQQRKLYKPTEAVVLLTTDLKDLKNQIFTNLNHYFKEFVPIVSDQFIQNQHLPIETCLRFKGLERYQVFLMCKNLTGLDDFQKYELMVGASRAQIQLNIYQFK